MTYHLSRLCFWLAVPCGKIALNEEKYFPNPGSVISKCRLVSLANKSPAQWNLVVRKCET